MRKCLLLFVAVMMGAGAFSDGVTVTAITAKQRYPWNGKVDIAVVMNCPSNELDVVAFFSAKNNLTGEMIPVTHISRCGKDLGEDRTWTRKFIWDAVADIGAVKIDDVALTVEVASGGVQLWENGPYWAECNVGASKPEEYGYYFWWGDTVGYKRNASNNGWVSSQSGTSFSFTSGSCPTYDKSKSTLQSQGYIDSTGNLVAKYDAATAHLGTPWRMPTSLELDALINNCTTTWTTRNGVYGRLVTGKGAYASKSIFLPAAGDGFGSRLGSDGFYWSSTPFSDDSFSAWGLYFDSGDFYRYDYGSRYHGQSVRPLRGFAK